MEPIQFEQGGNTGGSVDATVGQPQVATASTPEHTIEAIFTQSDNLTPEQQAQLDEFHKSKIYQTSEASFAKARERRAQAEARAERKEALEQELGTTLVDHPGEYVQPEHKNVGGAADQAFYEGDKRTYQELVDKYEKQFEQYGIDKDYNKIDTSTSANSSTTYANTNSQELLITAAQVDGLLDEIQSQLITPVENKMSESISILKNKVNELWDSASGTEMATIIDKKINETIETLNGLRDTFDGTIRELAEKVAAADKRVADSME